jgi:hypothetical protein
MVMTLKNPVLDKDQLQNAIVKSETDQYLEVTLLQKTT